MKKLILINIMICIALFSNAQNEKEPACFNEETLLHFKKDSYRKSFNEIKELEEYQLFLSSKTGEKALKKLYVYFKELQLGLWVEKNQKITFLTTETNGKATITITTIVERNLSKEEQKSIRNKVPKSSYKTAKYHQIGKKIFKLNFDVIDGNKYISDTNTINELKTVR